MNLIDHARNELQIAQRNHRKIDGVPVQSDTRHFAYLANCVLDLIKVFAGQGHSGGSAPCAIAMFNQLAQGRDFEEPDEWMDGCVGELMKTLVSQKHDIEADKNYVLTLFNTLANYSILTPLTGADDEWDDVSDYVGQPPLFQNQRLSRVFKDDTKAWDIDGKMYWEWFTDPDTKEKTKIYFTNGDGGSNTPVTFPYTPTTVYEEAPQESA